VFLLKGFKLLRINTYAGMDVLILKRLTLHLHCAIVFFCLGRKVVLLGSCRISDRFTYLLIYQKLEICQEKVASDLQEGAQNGGVNKL
jgi:hypothetical protein